MARTPRSTLAENNGGPAPPAQFPTPATTPVRQQARVVRSGARAPDPAPQHLATEAVDAAKNCVARAVGALNKIDHPGPTDEALRRKYVPALNRVIIKVGKASGSATLRARQYDLHARAHIERSIEQSIPTHGWTAFGERAQAVKSAIGQELAKAHATIESETIASMQEEATGAVASLLEADAEVTRAFSLEHSNAALSAVDVDGAEVERVARFIRVQPTLKKSLAARNLLFEAINLGEAERAKVIAVGAVPLIRELVEDSSVLDKLRGNHRVGPGMRRDGALDAWYTAAREFLIGAEDVLNSAAPELAALSAVHEYLRAVAQRVCGVDYRDRRVKIDWNKRGAVKLDSSGGLVVDQSLQWLLRWTRPGASQALSAIELDLPAEFGE